MDKTKAESDKKTMKWFDLNIEKILDHWKISDALREIISNAIDETRETECKDLEILMDSDGVVHIKDYGRGLTYRHLTLNENPWKIEDKYAIGKFGIGLKDALAVLHRYGARVEIHSTHETMVLGTMPKQGFEDIMTLHVGVSESPEAKTSGTEFIIHGISESELAEAKEFFLRFSNEKVLETNQFGQVIQNNGKSHIFMNGVRVNTEDYFLFSYNITPATSAIKKMLNRERNNVGRGAYKSTLEKILLECRNGKVADALMEDFNKSTSGGFAHDEVGWVKIQEHAVKLLNEKKDVVFMTHSQALNETSTVDEARRGNKEIRIIPDDVAMTVSRTVDYKGEPIRTMEKFQDEINRLYEYKFVDTEELTPYERKIYELTEKILKLAHVKVSTITGVRISETLRTNTNGLIDAEGVWSPGLGIIVRRSALKSKEKYAGVLLHEISHAISGKPDVNRDFEISLSDLMGRITANFI